MVDGAPGIREEQGDGSGAGTCEVLEAETSSGFMDRAIASPERARCFSAALTKLRLTMPYAILADAARIVPLSVSCLRRLEGGKGEAVVPDGRSDGPRIAHRSESRGR